MKVLLLLPLVVIVILIGVLVSLLRGGFDFTVYNHLAVPISVVIGDKKMRVESGKTSKIRLNDLPVGSVIDVYILKDKRYEVIHKKLATYKVEKEIKELRVGMITSRWTNTHMGVPVSPGNATGGMSTVNLINLTDFDITLNDKSVASKGLTPYRGKDGLGVRIGTILVDEDGVFPDFKIETPATDIYYGVVSDSYKELFSGWQESNEYKDKPADPIHHLLEQGHMGGPPMPTINYSSLPREGETVNRWGQ